MIRVRFFCRLNKMVIIIFCSVVQNKPFKLVISQFYFTQLFVSKNQNIKLLSFNQCLTFCDIFEVNGFISQFSINHHLTYDLFENPLVLFITVYERSEFFQIIIFFFDIFGIYFWKLKILFILDFLFFSFFFCFNWFLNFFF